MQSQEQIVSITSHPMMMRRLSTRKCLNWKKKLGFLSDHLRDINWIIKSQKRMKRKRSKHISQSIIQRKRLSYSRALVQPGEDQVIQLVIARRIDQSLSTLSRPRSHKRSRKKLSSTWTQFFLTLVCLMQLIARRTSTCCSITLMSPSKSRRWSSNVHRKYLVDAWRTKSYIPSQLRASWTKPEWSKRELMDSLRLIWKRTKALVKASNSLKKEERLTRSCTKLS